MSLGKVFITDYVDNPTVESNILKNSLTRDINSSDIEVLLVWNQIIDNNFLNRFPNLKGIVRYGVGIDKINVEAVKKKNLIVCNTPDYAMEEVSDTAIGMLLNITRGLNFYDYTARKSLEKWKKNTPIKQIKRNKNYNIGSLGAGRIGSVFIKKAENLGFKVLYYDPYLKNNLSYGLRIEELSIFLEKSDIISIHTPLTDETRNLIDEKFIQKVKDGTSIINTARGKIIKDLDLIYDALKTNKLYSVALDVLPEEPPTSNKLIDSWLNRDEISPRIMINPHVSYYSSDSFEDCRSKASKNALKLLNKEEPTNLVYNFKK